MNKNMNFRNILVPKNDFLATKPEICSSSRMEREQDRKELKVSSFANKGERTAFHGQKLLPRTFIFVKADYKFSSVQIYITYI